MDTEDNTYLYYALSCFGVRPAAPAHECYRVPIRRRWLAWWRIRWQAHTQPEDWV